MKDTFIFHYPFGPLQITLEKIREGKKDIWVDMDRLGEIGEDEDPEELAKYLYDVEKGALKSSRFSDFYEVERPDFVHSDQKWVVRQLLNQVGELVLNSLLQGWVWDATKGHIDVEETILFYQKKIREGSIPNELADLLVNNKDERLRGVRGELTLMRLAGERTNGHIVKARHNA